MRTDKKPKILSFSHYGPLYGANRSLLTLLTATRDQIDWWVICLEDGDFPKELARNGIECRVVKFANDIHKAPRFPQWFHSIKRFVFNVLAALYIALLVIRKRIDLIHTNSSVIFFGALVAFFSGRKHLWHIREFVYEDYQLKYNFGKSSFRFWANKAARIICISKSIAQKRVIEAGVTAPHVVIYNGLVDTLPEVSPRVRPETPLAGIVGIIDPAKGQMIAVKAVNALVKKGIPIKLEIVGEIGDTAYYEEIAAYIKEQGISEHIQFTGFTKDIQSIYRRLDVLLMCSPNEALGRVTIEGMMYGVPVVAFDSAGTSEIVQHGQTGLLYRSDEYSLAAELERLLNDHSLYAGLAGRAREHVFQNFTITKYRDNFIREVESCRQS
ncbi:glycosyltransferase involved in cell wall biosynthesis [Dyadobacter sp. BE34]|uniref:Glycosyltransferase involved in cell wall biosynthesis n=1 Tax=Dyadobacter fermentans TaxID=94254 RepID=A0ABU1QR12_9BACT|nr:MULTISPECIES: glycosyltransferase family 4 protein [Dyadobacter]MDR6803571.1 glycosyltransferase involved in cell wall biosynthesis [Dyadobacter fermentans]MDR7041311.1 glycosyltransferase involved in cell wall biosynthesis [Dyadobacter sp. BE242]MDR7195715.1 glycosyltransferase involved in cell wall biosynthesis [Dyadobacter sp. BE34]MDR7213741.1 glycosyltransferase involved in cell wall biosynthesis [Dyadobacter sp. BE31]MDR7261121.1 glycosyltransferase involved in cell wall biosynthesis 